MVKIKVFIAVEFTEEIKQFLWEKQQIIKRESLKGNFTHKENFHLTLRFIGEVEPRNIEGFKKAIDAITLNLDPFTLEFKGVDQFPRGNKKIIWLGLNESKALKALYGYLEEALEREGYEKEERGFRPHITLGREIVLKENFNKLQSMLKVDPKKFLVSSVSLMESTRIEGKLVYLPVYVKKFG